MESAQGRVAHPVVLTTNYDADGNPTTVTVRDAPADTAWHYDLLDADMPGLLSVIGNVITICADNGTFRYTITERDDSQRIAYARRWRDGDR